MFRVKWKLTALNELAAQWMDADAEERAKVTQASRELDLRLSQDPYAASESQFGRIRVAFLLPLGVQFEVDRKGGTVTVLHVNLVRRRKK